MGGKTRLRRALRHFLRIDDMAAAAPSPPGQAPTGAIPADPAPTVSYPPADELAQLAENVRLLAGELSRQSLGPAAIPEAPPARQFTTCQPARAADFASPAFAYWCQRTGQPRRHYRKLWEHAYILQIAHQEGVLRPGMRALGFGCGREPLPAVLAAAGVEVVATDLPPDRPEATAWTTTNQHAAGLETLRRPGICPDEDFDRLVSFRAVDMTAIPDELAGGFDFCWSACALEHIGGLAPGIDFLAAQLACLKPGGVFVHTTEYNVSSNEETVESPLLSVYRRRDIEAAAARLEAAGARLYPLDFDAGDSALDAYVDLPPYAKAKGLHLKLALGRFVITCYGIAGRLAADGRTG
ncbi:MAG: hypothetical protein RLO50_00290 [Azospirillaceae bacterium]